MDVQMKKIIGMQFPGWVINMGLVSDPVLSMVLRDRVRVADVIAGGEEFHSLMLLFYLRKGTLLLNMSTDDWNVSQVIYNKGDDFLDNDNNKIYVLRGGYNARALVEFFKCVTE